MIVNNHWTVSCVTYFSNFPTLCPQLVDLRLCDVSTLLSLLHLVLHLPVPGQVSVGLLLL